VFQERQSTHNKTKFFAPRAKFSTRRFGVSNSVKVGKNVCQHKVYLQLSIYFFVSLRLNNNTDTKTTSFFNPLLTVLTILKFYHHLVINIKIIAYYHYIFDNLNHRYFVFHFGCIKILTLTRLRKIQSSLN
jgi:hypothetical protein